MPELASTRNIPFVLFMLNNPLGSSWLIDALGQDRVLLGLPGAGGTLEGHVVHYAVIARQPLANRTGSKLLVCDLWRK